MLTVVVIFYLGLSLLVGAFLSRRVKKASDFLIAGRKLGLLLTTATLSAVQIGAGVMADRSYKRVFCRLLLATPASHHLVSDKK